MTNAKDMRYQMLTYLDAVWKCRRLILIVLLCSPIVGLLVSHFSSKRYESSISLATFNTLPAYLKDVSSIPELETQFSGLKAYITSPVVLKKAALEADILDKNASEKTAQELIKDLSKAITVTSSGKNLAEIKFVSSSPKHMVALLNGLGNAFMAEYLKPISASAQSLTVLLEKESRAQAIKLNEAIEKVNLFKSDKNNTLTEEGSIYTTQLKTIVDAIATSEGNYNAAVEEKKWLEKSFANSNSELANLDREISENNTNLSKMKQIYAANYPGIKEAEDLAKKLKSDREKLYKDIANAQKNNPKVEVKASDQFLSADQYASLTEVEVNQYVEIQQRISGLKEKVKDLQKQQENVLNQLKVIAGHQNQLDVLTKAVTENQKSYDELLKQYNLAKMSAQLNYADELSPIKVVSTPQEPIQTTGGRPALFFILGAFLAGLILSVVLAIVLDMLDNSARKRGTLEALTQVPVIARVGNVSV